MSKYKDKIAASNSRLEQVKANNATITKINELESNYTKFESAFTKLVSVGANIQDIKSKVDNHTQTINEHDNKIDVLSTKDQEIDAKIAGHTQLLNDQDEAIVSLFEQDQGLQEVVDNHTTEISNGNKVIIEVRDEFHAFKNKVINLAESSKVSTYSEKYKMALPESKNSAVCVIPTDEKLYSFVYTNGAYKDCACPDAYEPVYHYDDEDSTLAYIGCSLKSDGCSDSTNGQELMRGEDGICYAHAL
jgi:chromosome segregation ATPase